MPRTRRDVWKLQQPWDDVLLFYARAVGVLKKREAAKRNSWAFFGGMHGFDEPLWQAFGYLSPANPPPSAADRAQFWEQCQHQTWYFLPWHRGYLAALEAALRRVIVEDLQGPSDWALPYWNYSDTTNPNALKLPPAFSQPKLPSGEDNPLFETRRYGDGTGHVVIRAQDVELTALRERRFEGAAIGGTTGFGGVRTPFRHGGPNSANGRVERQPHNILHGLVGGRLPQGDPEDPESYGLMSLPDTAGLDPIFWLHHANIDRLWDVWNKRDPANTNPTDAAWRTGPADRRFALPMPDGAIWKFTSAEVVNTQAVPLDYIYESTADPFGGVNFDAQRLAGLGMSDAPGVRSARAAAMTQPPPAELVGANDEIVRLEGEAVETNVRVDPAAVARTMATLDAGLAMAGQADPDRVFLNLENIRGVNDAAVFYVYVNHPSAAVPEALIGAVSLFGVRKATATDQAAAGNGITESLEMTDWVDQLRAAGVQDLNDIRVRLVPRTAVRPEDNISVGRISIYRQGS